MTRHLGHFEPDIRYTSGDFLIQLELVRTTGAGALLPDLVLANDAPGVAVRGFAEGAVGREVSDPTRQNRSPIVKAVFSALQRAAGTAFDLAVQGKGEASKDLDCPSAVLDRRPAGPP